MTTCPQCKRDSNEIVYFPDKSKDTSKKKRPVCLDCTSKKTRQNWTKITRTIQATETQLDSASQKLLRQLGPTEEVKKVIFGLKQVRKIQDGYFPIQERSLKRVYDSVDKDGNYSPHLSKQNFKKYRKNQDIKKGKQDTLFP